MKRILGFIGIIAAALFVFGCTKSEQTVEVPEVMEEPAVSEPAPEPVVEEPEVVETPEIVEEPEEEPVVEYDYSAQHIMELVEDTYFYAPSFNKDQIAAIVIGINLDHISEEDMQTLIDTYGHSLEEFNQLYLEGLDYMRDFNVNYISMLRNEKYSQEMLDTYREEEIDFDHMVICKDYKDRAIYAENSYYKWTRGFEYNDDYDDAFIELDKQSSEEKGLFDLTYYVTGGFNSIGISNPYTNVLNE